MSAAGQRDWADLGAEVIRAQSPEPEPAKWTRCSELQPYPFEALPGALRDLARAAEAAFGYPGELVALPGLAVLAAAIGGSYDLEVVRGFVAPAVLFTAVIASPGAGKTPALDLATRPLVELEVAWSEAYDKHQVAKWCRDRADDEATPPPSRGRRGAGSIILPFGDDEAASPPLRRRCRAADITFESLRQPLMENAGTGLVIEAAELTGLVSGLDQYKPAGRGADGARLLTLWDGRALQFDRLDQRIIVARPRVSVTGSIQPAKLKHLLGRGDGLGARFLLVNRTDAGLATPRFDHGLTDDTEAGWRQLARRLVVEPDDPRPPRVETRRLTLSASGKRAMARATETFRSAFQAPGVSPLGQEVIAKATSQLARLSLILHVAGGAGAEVGAEPVERAYALVNHAIAAALSVDPGEPSSAADLATVRLDAGVDKLRGWVQRRPEHYAAASDVLASGVAGVKTQDERDRLLDRYGERFPGCVLEGRRPGVITGRFGTTVYAPGYEPEPSA